MTILTECILRKIQEAFITGNVKIKKGEKTVLDYQAIKDRMSVLELWQRLDLPNCPSRSGITVKSPFREENNGSFSVYEDGNKWKDHATGDGGDIYDFYQIATQCSEEASYKAVAGMAGMADTGHVVLRPPKRVNGSKKAHEPFKYNGEQVAFRRDCCARLIHEQSPGIVKRAIDRGWDIPTLKSLAIQSALGQDGDGKMVYFYGGGAKKRWGFDTSHGDRWLFGGPGGLPWRADDPFLLPARSVFLTEGESDTIKLLKARPEADTELYCAIPGASWTPDPVTAYKIAADRKVFLAFDNDDAGKEATERVAEVLQEEASRCEAYALDWRKVSRKLGKSFKDLSELPNNFLQNKFDSFFQPI